uniref:WSN domain-containing protein n=1 Tax=Caenorhabditis tropicalis TaxID=1561998 RepID=A0A1I7TVU1_9PELO
MAPHTVQIEVLQVDVRPRPMTLEEVKEAADYLDKSIDVAKSLIDIGKASLEFLKDEKVKKLWNDRLSVVAGVGDIIKGLTLIIPGPENPMVGQLKDMADRIEELGDKVSNNFDEMKALITEVNFFVNILSPTFVLTRYMRDCFKNVGPEAKENFTKAYKKHPPIKLVYNLMSCLEQKSTNPIRMAMDAEKAKTKATFKKWEDIISRIMGQFMFLEAFASGLLGTKSKATCEILLTRSTEVFDQMNKWKEEYKKDQGYWEHLKVVLKDYVEKNSRLGLAERAEGIKAELEKYLTSDAFYISVHFAWDHVNWGWMNTVAGEDQFIHINGYGYHNLNTFVYRSKLANSVEIEKLEAMKLKVWSFKTDAYRDKMPQALLDDPIPNAGFTILYGKLREEIRWANCPRREYGPGWWTETFNFGGPDPRRLFVGYL